MPVTKNMSYSSVWLALCVNGTTCTVPVHISAFKLVCGVEFQSICHKHKCLAAKTGIVGTELDRPQRRKKLLKTFFMYRYIFIYFFHYDTIMGHETLDYKTQPASWEHHHSLFSLRAHSGIGWKFRRPDRSESEFISAPPTGAGTTTHTASDVVLCLYTRVWYMLCIWG